MMMLLISQDGAKDNQSQSKTMFTLAYARMA